MKFGLNDNAVKRIAAVAHHHTGSVEDHIHEIYGKLHDPDTITRISMAHMTDAMQHRFKDKNEENNFKRHLSIAAAINRGTLEVKTPKGKGSEPKSGDIE